MAVKKEVLKSKSQNRNLCCVSRIKPNITELKRVQRHKYLFRLRIFLGYFWTQKIWI